jgi:hypothetical protein
MAVGKRARFEVFKRDKFTCQYCGHRPPDVLLEVDHIVPRAEGGGDEMANLTTACLSCNRGKAGIPLEDVAPALDELEQLSALQEMLERKRAVDQEIRVAQAQRDTEAEAVGVIVEWWMETFGNRAYVQEVSLRSFVRQLDLNQIREAIESTERRGSYRRMSGVDRWKYFCGACWSMIRRLEVQDGSDG